MQGVTKLVIQKSAVITCEIEVTIWSGTFQKLHIVLQFSLLRNPASHHAVAYRCESGTVLFVVSRNRSRPLPFSENSRPIITKYHPKE
jgi:hypothetical protein